MVRRARVGLCKGVRGADRTGVRCTRLRFWRCTSRVSPPFAPPSLLVAPSPAAVAAAAGRPISALSAAAATLRCVIAEAMAMLPPLLNIATSGGVSGTLSRVRPPSGDTLWAEPCAKGASFEVVPLVGCGRSSCGDREPCSSSSVDALDTSLSVLALRSSPANMTAGGSARARASVRTTGYLSLMNSKLI